MCISEGRNSKLLLKCDNLIQAAISISNRVIVSCTVLYQTHTQIKSMIMFFGAVFLLSYPKPFS